MENTLHEAILQYAGGTSLSDHLPSALPSLVQGLGGSHLPWGHARARFLGGRGAVQQRAMAVRRPPAVGCCMIVGVSDDRFPGPSLLWQVATILGNGDLGRDPAFRGTEWAYLDEHFEHFDDHVRLQNRAVLDLDVPREAAVWAAAVSGLLVYGTPDGLLRSADRHGGKAMPLATVVWLYGAAVAAEVLEYGSAKV